MWTLKIESKFFYVIAFFKKQLNYTFFNISNCTSVYYDVYSGLFTAPDYT